MVDPQQANYGRARYGQIAPRQSAEYDAYQQKVKNPRLGALQGGTAEQAQQQQQPQQSAVQDPPMRSALARPSIVRNPQPQPQQEAEAQATGQLAPMASQMAPPQGKPMSTHNQAYQQIQQLARQQQPPPQQVQQAPQQAAPVVEPVQQPQPMQPAPQAPQAVPPAQTAYQEYLQELDEGEQPLDYGQFEALFSQIPPDQLQMLMSGEEPAAQPQAAPQFARQGFNGINLDMVGPQATPMGLLGFNTERAFAGGDEKSMKDALGRAFATNPIDLRGKSKQEVGAYLASPEFEAHLAQNGLQKGVHWDVKPGEYDIIMVNSMERGWEPVDIVGNAGSGDATWTYQALMDAQQQGANPMQGALMQGVDPTTGLPLQAQDEQQAYWELLLQQLQQDQEAAMKENPLLFTPEY